MHTQDSYQVRKSNSKHILRCNDVGIKPNLIKAFEDVNSNICCLRFCTFPNLEPTVFFFSSLKRFLEVLRNATGSAQQRGAQKENGLPHC